MIERIAPLFEWGRGNSLPWKGSQGSGSLGLISEVPIDGFTLHVPLTGTSGRLQTPPCFERSLVREAL